MSSLIERWCDREGNQIVVTRTRAPEQRQRWVEHKSPMLVRRVVGYTRLEGLVAAQLLGELDGALRLFTNLFQPSLNLSHWWGGGWLNR